MLAVTYQTLKETLAAAISGHHYLTAGNLLRLHARVVVSGLAGNGYLAALLVSRYFCLGDTNAARDVFDAVPKTASNTAPKPLLYNAMLRGYLAHGLPHLALHVFQEMVCPPDHHTYHLALTACVHTSHFELGRCIGGDAAAKGFASDLLVATALIDMYFKEGDQEAALKVFDEMSRRDVVVWNAVISGYVRAGCLARAMQLFKKMRFADGVLPTKATLVSLVSGYASSGSRESGEAMHAYAIKSGFHRDLFVSNSLLEMYVKCGCLGEAITLFDQIVVKDSISWSSMIGGFVRNGQPDSALRLFRWMVSNSGVRATRSILLNVILACAELRDWREGKWVEENYVLCNGSEFKGDSSLVTALIYMYAKCGKIDSSLSLLHGVAEVRDDVIAWNAVIKACKELGQVESALGFAAEMQRIGVDPDSVTFLEILSLISSIPSLKKAMETHSQIVKRGFENERPIANSLISMYGRCGSIRHSLEVFNYIVEKDVISWTSMIQVYAWNGHVAEVLNLFELLKKTEVGPNCYTFLAVLSACRNMGLVEEGINLLKCMKEQYGLEPEIEHLSCIVDMLCRAGRLTDAYHLIESSRFEHANNPTLWGTLLSASRSCGDLAIGEAAARQLLLLEPQNAANYKMLADVYISVGRREDGISLLRLLRSRETDSRPGCSWTEGG